MRSRALLRASSRRNAGRVDPPGSALPLHQGMQRHGADAQDELGAQHALTPHHPDLEHRLALDGRDQRNKALLGKIHMARWLARLTQHGAKLQLHGGRAGEQSLPVAAGQ